MAYFYVGRRKAPMLSVTRYMTAAVIEADSLNDAKRKFHEYIQSAVDAGVECAEAFEILALNGLTSNAHGVVAGSFISDL